MKQSVKFLLIAGLLLIAALISLLSRGAVSTADLWSALLGNAPDEAAQDILWSIRLPRLLGAAAAGMLLSAAGCTVQVLFRNPLSSPHVLGAVNASALGAVLVMALGGSSMLMMLAGSGAGALLAIFLLLLIGQAHRQTASLLLAGIALNAFASAAMSGILFVAGERLEGLVFWLLGGFWRLEWQGSCIMLGMALIISTGGLFMHREMNMLYLGERAAAAAGVDTRKVIAGAVLFSALATAVTVAYCGVIGFVGLLIPHMARRIFGADFRSLLPGAALLGAWLMIVADWAGRSLFMPLEVPVGVLTSVIGAPFFLLLVVCRLKNSRGE